MWIRRGSSYDLSAPGATLKIMVPPKRRSLSNFGKEENYRARLKKTKTKNAVLWGSKLRAEGSLRRLN